MLQVRGRMTAATCSLSVQQPSPREHFRPQMPPQSSPVSSTSLTPLPQISFVGDTVGLDVGRGDGDADGDALGDALGNADGAAVGLGLGAWVVHDP